MTATATVTEAATRVTEDAVAVAAVEAGPAATSTISLNRFCGAAAPNTETMEKTWKIKIKLYQSQEFYCR
jgi:hypothetical protein